MRTLWYNFQPPINPFAPFNTFNLNVVDTIFFLLTLHLILWCVETWDQQFVSCWRHMQIPCYLNVIIVQPKVVFTFFLKEFGFFEKFKISFISMSIILIYFVWKRKWKVLLILFCKICRSIKSMLFNSSLNWKYWLWTDQKFRC